MIIKTEKEISEMISKVHKPLLKLISIKESTKPAIEDDYTSVETLLGDLLTGSLIGNKWFKFIPRIVKLITQNVEMCKVFLSIKTKEDIIEYIGKTFSGTEYVN